MSEPERESLELDVVFVGAGPASLAGATHLANLIESHNQANPKAPIEIEIAVLEKGQEVGSHTLSGAVVDPRALRELYPRDWREAPLEAEVSAEKLLFLTRTSSFPMPIPPPMENDGKYVASLGKLVKWMAAKAEERGIDIFCEFPGAEILVEGDRVVGVRTGDRGVDKNGGKKSNYEPGVDILAQAVVLGEGPRGTLTKQLEEQLDLLGDSNPQTYAIGVKEVWELPKGRVAPGMVWHTMGFPLDLKTTGGGFVYGMKDDLLIVGLVINLDYSNPHIDPHMELQRFKTHPMMREILDEGTMVYYGAKAIPEGGWWSIPRLGGKGFAIVGDSGGLLNSQRLKGIHLAMKSGMLAAEEIFSSLERGSLREDDLIGYESRLESSWAGEELKQVRNFHQSLELGMLGGVLQTILGMLTRGRGWGIFDRLSAEPGHTKMRRLNGALNKALEAPEPVEFDGKLTFDKLASVYNSATSHEEDQPVHLQVLDLDICLHQCAVEYGNPCQNFCPASVYEMVDDDAQPTGRRLQINASNCVHCKTCDIMDPYQIINWVTPEGGGGPSYSKM
jgi:electron-transferring-flavoprotein dehydrogenase